MVAGQSCIAGPSVCLTLCHARFLSGASFFFRQHRQQKRSWETRLAGGECRQGPTQHERTHALPQDRRNRVRYLCLHSCQVTCRGYDTRVSRGAQAFLQF